MNDVARRLLQVDQLDPLAEGVRFTFAHPIPAWGWLVAVLVAGVAGVWSYHHVPGRRVGRGLLACARAGLLLLLLVLVSGPQLTEQTEVVERDWVLVLVDRSASLTVADVEGGGGGARVSREDELRGALERTWPGWRELSATRTVVWLGFDGGSYELGVQGSGASGREGEVESVNLGEADGSRTALGRAVDQALGRAAARPLAAVVVVSDGRSVDAVSRGALRRLKGEKIPVHTVALGSAEALGDLAVRSVEAPGLAFVNDGVPVRVVVERLGGAGVLGGVIRVVDASTGEVLDEQRVEFAEGDEASREVLLSHSEAEAGERELEVRVVPDGADLISENDAQRVSVSFTDRPLRVLHVDGYARWEQRYLRNLLIREPTVVVSSLLLAPDRRYTQEGDRALVEMPDSPEGWAEFDVVILGDVRPDVFTPGQLMMMRDQVALGGGGVLWIGGSASTPASWWNTPLADLLPMGRAAFDGAALGGPSVVSPTDAAGRLGVLRLAGAESASGWPAELSDGALGWPRLQWAQWIAAAGLKPTAQVLATARVVGDEAQHPMVMTMRYGAGRVVYVATDEVWRWRFGRGELLYDRFWLQLVRMLGRETLGRAGKGFQLTVSPRRAELGGLVRVGVELIDQSLIDRRESSIEVKLEAEDGSGEALVELRPEDGSGRVYSGVWSAASAGAWRAAMVDRSTFGGEAAEFEVFASDDELRRAAADHGALRAVSDETGGLALRASEMGRVFDQMPNRTLRQVRERSESLWDTPLALVLVLFFVTFEWVGRRVLRLI